jgi:hypothetical protein
MKKEQLPPASVKNYPTAKVPKLYVLCFSPPHRKGYPLPSLFVTHPITMELSPIIIKRFHLPSCRRPQLPT